MQQILELIKISRPGFWLTHLWFYLLPFAEQNLFATIPFWLGAIYVTFPLGLLLYGWNDLGDVETDAHNPRKGNWLFGAKPDAATRRRLPWFIVAVQIPFLISFVYFADLKMFGWFAAVVFVNATYNSMGFKRIPVVDLLNQVGYLLVFVLASWLCSVEQLNRPAMLFAALFAMQSHLFGQIMDLEQDEQAGRRSTAVSIGVVRSKLLLSSIMLVESAIAYFNFRGTIVAIFMMAGAVYFLLDALFGPKRYPLVFVTSFFIGWNIVCLTTMHFIWRYGLFQLT